MNKLIFICVALLMLSSVKEVKAQGGYLGKKTALYVYGDVTSYQRFSLYAQPWQKRVGLAIARTVNRNLEVSVGAQYTKGGMYPSLVRGRPNGSKTKIKDDNMYGFGGKIGFRRFRYTTGAISPIGRYWGMELSFDYFEVKDSFLLNTGGFNEAVNTPYRMAYVKGQIWFKVGWQTILGEHILVGGEVRTGVIPVVVELTSTNSSGFWIDGLSYALLDEFMSTGNGLVPFEFGRNLFVPEVHLAYLF
ncbi:MAG: hypothetical protein ACI84C_000055 [Flavobacteriales bacterium]|jgi:hypothetical protein